ncbi:hypothetical protein DL768_003320 [Monosporascus sp. mg162]|nr:hypothetical protein DL768_003320 [Monosporascus sp. mg162]
MWLDRIRRNAVPSARPLPREYKERLVKDYESYFAGNLEMAETILQPNIVLKTDRHLFGNMSVPLGAANLTQANDYVTLIRTGWDQADFGVTRWFEDEYAITVRWTFNGTLGADFSSLKTNLPQGSPVIFHDMDILTLGPCRGKIADAYIFQDQMEMIYQMGGRTITL